MSGYWWFWITIADWTFMIRNSSFVLPTRYRPQVHYSKYTSNLVCVLFLCGSVENYFLWSDLGIVHSWNKENYYLGCWTKKKVFLVYQISQDSEAFLYSFLYCQYSSLKSSLRLGFVDKWLFMIVNIMVPSKNHFPVYIDENMICTLWQQ